MAKKTKSVKKDSTVKKIEELEKICLEHKEKYLRLLAEWENYRKRTIKEQSMSVKYGREDIICKILPILDDFYRAEKAREKTKKNDGFSLIQQKLIDVLEKEGLQKIQTQIGQDFDVNEHEAISQIPIEKKELKGKIIEELEVGYMLNAKIIRFSKVVIGK